MGKHLGVWMAALAWLSISAFSRGAELVAQWQDFKGLSASADLAPHAGRACREGTWTFRLNGGSVADGALTTGTGAAPTILFNGTAYQMGGYNLGGYTLVMKAHAATGFVATKPLWELGSAIGVTLTGASEMRGIWNNALWSNTGFSAHPFSWSAEPAGTLFAFCNKGADVAAAMEIYVNGTQLLPNPTGLQGATINATQFFFGNYSGATANGNNFKIDAIALYNGRPTNAGLAATPFGTLTWQGAQGLLWTNRAGWAECDAADVYSSSRDVLFGANAAVAAGVCTVEVDHAVSAGQAYVSGAAYAFAGDGSVTCASLTVANGGALTTTADTTVNGAVVVAKGVLDVPASPHAFTANALTVRAAGILAVDPGAATPMALATAPVFAAGASLDCTDADPGLAPGTYPLITWQTGSVAVLPTLESSFENPAQLLVVGSALALRITDIPPVTVMPLGDSITEGSSSGANYRILLAEKMAAAGYTPRFVGFRTLKNTNASGVVAPEAYTSHSGISGQRIITTSGRAGFLDGVDVLLDQAGDPDVILLLIGANDLGDSTANPGALFNAWTSLVWRVTTTCPHSRLIVSTVMDFGRNESLVADFNGRVRAQMALASGAPGAFPARVTMVDLQQAVPHLVPQNFPADDVVHPNWTGHGLASDAWLAGIQAVLSPTGQAGAPQPVVARNALDLAAQWLEVTFHRPVTAESVLTATATLSGGVALSNPILQADKRTVRYALSAPLVAGGDYTYTATGVACYDEGVPACADASLTFEARTTGAEANVPAAYRDGFTKQYVLEPGEHQSFARDAIPAYAWTNTVDLATGHLASVGYYVELVRKDTQKLRHLWVDMDAFGNQTLADVGLPTQNTRQQVVSRLHVHGNVASVDAVAADDDSVSGFVEFGPSTYAATASGIAGAPAKLLGGYDWNDTLSTGAGLYGCMQAHRLQPPNANRAAQTLFAYNRWSLADGAKDIGIGNFVQHFSGVSLDYTYMANYPTLSSEAYDILRIEIWAKPAASLVWNGPDGGNWNTPNLWLEGATPATFTERADVAFSVLGACELFVDQTNFVRTMALADTQTDYVFSGGGALDILNLAASGAGSASFAVPVSADSLSLAPPAKVSFGATTSVSTVAGGGALALEAPATVAVGTWGASQNGSAEIGAGSTLRVSALQDNYFGAALAGGGTIEVNAPAWFHFACDQASFTGTIHVVSTTAGGYTSFGYALNGRTTATPFLNRPDLHNDGPSADNPALVLGGSFAGEAMEVGNFHGKGHVRVDVDTATGMRTLDTRMTRDNAFSGRFLKGTNGRAGGLTVRAAQPGLTLALSGDNNEDAGLLTAADGATVLISGASGKWSGPVAISEGATLAVDRIAGALNTASPKAFTWEGCVKLVANASGSLPSLTVSTLTVGDGATLKVLGPAALRTHLVATYTGVAPSQLPEVPEGFRWVHDAQARTLSLEKLPGLLIVVR